MNVEVALGIINYSMIIVRVEDWTGMLVLFVFLIVCQLLGEFRRNDTWLFCLFESFVRHLFSFRFCFQVFIITSLLFSNQVCLKFKYFVDLVLI